MRQCTFCETLAVGRCRDCRRLYCEDHGHVLCRDCRASRRWPMALGCLTASFPTATCFLVGVTNRLFGLDIIGPLGVVLVFVALLIALAIARQVWLHPEGFKPPVEE